MLFRRASGFKGLITNVLLSNPVILSFETTKGIAVGSNLIVLHRLKH
jgi:hypothetical protein